jgi:SsrA-binding protein
MSKHDKNKKLTERIENRKAYHDYFVHEKLEVGIQLKGTEVKSLRHGNATLSDSFAQVEGKSMELWLYQMDIGPYNQAAPEFQHEPKRPRKLLAHRKEIENLLVQSSKMGMTLVPLALYFNAKGIAKVELGIATGKGRSDKREDMKKKDAERGMKRMLTRKRI